jgi:RNA polymerase sigma factor (sigma-70 family)
MTDTQTTHPSLLLRIRDVRDADSWSNFVATYAPLVQGFLRRRGLQDADAADLTQEVLARVATAIKGFEYDPERGSFRGWLFTIVENCLRRFSAQERPGRRGSGDTRVLHALAQHPADDLEEEWDRQYQRHLLERAAHEVRGDFQVATWRAFWGTAVEGRAPQEVAAELGMSIASVYMAKHRITGRLRQHVQYLEGGQS